MKRPGGIPGTVAVLGLAAAILAAKAAPPAPAPGYGKLPYEIPEPGTYRLPPLGPAGDGRVLDTRGRSHRLEEYLGGKLVVLSFIYSSCNDVNGCPLATWVLSRTQAGVVSDPALRNRVRFVSLSFDPARDTPEVMADYGGRFADPQMDWRFLTTAGKAELDPILEAYGQSLVRDPGGEVAAGGISHILRVYLIDPSHRIRNIYSASFLHPDLLLADLRTLVAEGEPPP